MLSLRIASSGVVSTHRKPQFVQDFQNVDLKLVIDIASSKALRLGGRQVQFLAFAMQPRHNPGNSMQLNLEGGSNGPGEALVEYLHVIGGR